MKKSIGFLLIAASSLPSFAAVTGKGTNSTVIIEHNKTELIFRVEPNKDLAISEDAPWSLKLSKVQNLSPSVLSLGRKDFDGKIPGFKVSLAANEAKPAEPASKSPGLSSFDYSITTFICTIDKKKCYRDVIKGKAEF